MLTTFFMLVVQVAGLPAPPRDTIRVGTMFRRDRLEPRMSIQRLYNVRNSERTSAGNLVRTRVPDGSRWLFISVSYAPKGGAESWDTLAVDGQTLAPRWHRSHAAHDSASVEYLGTSVRGWSRLHGLPRRVINTTLPSRAFPASMLEDLVGLVSLSRSYSAHVELYDMWNDSTESVDVRVTGTEQVPRNGQLVTAWVVDKLYDRGIRQMWIARGDGLLLRTHDRLPQMPAVDGSWKEMTETGLPDPAPR